MNWRGTLLLLAAVAVLAVVVFRDPTASGPAGVELSLAPVATVGIEPTPGRVLLQFAVADVEGLRLTRGAETVEVRRSNGNWGEPFRSRVIEALLQDIVGLRSLSEIPATATELVDFGLQPAQGSIRFEINGRPMPLTLHLGHHNPSTTAVYVRFDDDGPVYLAGALVAWKFNTALTQLTAH